MCASYPILYENRPIGTLETARDGLMTVFTAQCAAVCGDMLRLAVYGETDKAYLGLMLPEADGRLHLRKRLTRLELRRLPDPILFAADVSWEIPEAPPAAPPEAAKPAPPESAPPEADSPLDVLWFSAPDGTLSTFDGRRSLIAIPADAPQLPRGADGLLREINGRQYLVFPR